MKYPIGFKFSDIYGIVDAYRIVGYHDGKYVCEYTHPDDAKISRHKDTFYDIDIEIRIRQGERMKKNQTAQDARNLLDSNFNSRLNGATIEFCEALIQDLQSKINMVNTELTKLKRPAKIDDIKVGMKFYDGACCWEVTKILRDGEDVVVFLFSDGFRLIIEAAELFTDYEFVG